MGKGGHLEAPRHGAGKQPGKWQRSGLNRTAAPHPPRWSSWDRGAVEEFEGNGKWGALGEIRRAAVECQLDHVNDRGSALTIAHGPDGTRGFEMQRTRLDFNETGLETMRTTWQCPTIFYTLFCEYFVPALTLTFGVLLIWLLPSIVMGSVALWLCVCLLTYMHLERFAFIVTVMAAGMVVTCLIGDWAIDVAQLILQAFEGLELDAVRLATICGAYTVWGGSGDDVEDVENVFVLSCRGERNHRVYLSWSSDPSTGRVSSDSSKTEAGRLRRKAAAELFFKVFDPGGSTVSATAAAATAAATATRLPTRRARGQRTPRPSAPRA